LFSPLGKPHYDIWGNTGKRKHLENGKKVEKKVVGEDLTDGMSGYQIYIYNEIMKLRVK
jgi:hypothetical protein